MSAFGDYLRDTRAELRHVAWPTRMQTIVYTVLVALVSIGVSLYLGLFDYLFTGALERVIVNLAAQGGIQVTPQPAQPAPTQTGTPDAPSFDLTPTSRR